MDSTRRRRLLPAAIAGVCLFAAFPVNHSRLETAPAVTSVPATLVRHDVSPPLREMVAAAKPTALKPPASSRSNASAAVMRRRATGLALDQNFNGFAAQGGAIPNVPASDTTGAAGPNHYMQSVNFVATIYNRAASFSGRSRRAISGQAFRRAVADGAM